MLYLCRGKPTNRLKKNDTDPDMHTREFLYIDKSQRLVLTVLQAVALVCVAPTCVLG